MPATRRGTRAFGSLALGAALALVSCGDDDAAVDDGAPPSTVQEGPVAATEVAAGDCMNGIVIGAAQRAQIASAEVVSCDREHAFEVYATFGIAAADFDIDDPSEYPGPARVVNAADTGCAERIAQLIEDADAYGLIALWPSRDSWAAGDRDVACAVFSRDGAPFDRRQL
jgi:hypothetical protein